MTVYGHSRRVKLKFRIYLRVYPKLKCYIYASYGGDLRAMLRRAIAGERQAVQTYQQIAGRMEGAPKALMERIVQDEVHHIELFQRTLSELE